LPGTGFLHGEDQVAHAGIAWTKEHLAVFMESKLPFRNAFFPNVQQGESFEVFIDTRDRKDVRINNKFCHHFVFLPEEVDGVQAAEITRFRTDDAHPLCDPGKLQVFTKHKKTGFSLCGIIPADCLTGYDPDEFDRIGFTYRINFTGNRQQHFSVHSSEFSIEQNPALWGSLRLVK
jgi:hypothetical protein